MKKNKRIIVSVSPEVDEVRSRISNIMGVQMTYTQIMNFLVHAYLQQPEKPKTTWRPIA